jgi:hypothetical protein
MKRRNTRPPCSRNISTSTRSSPSPAQIASASSITRSRIAAVVAAPPAAGCRRFVAALFNFGVTRKNNCRAATPWRSARSASGARTKKKWVDTAPTLCGRMPGHRPRVKVSCPHIKVARGLQAANARRARARVDSVIRRFLHSRSSAGFRPLRSSFDPDLTLNRR